MLFNQFALHWWLITSNKLSHPNYEAHSHWLNWLNTYFSLYNIYIFKSSARINWNRCVDSFETVSVSNVCYIFVQFRMEIEPTLIYSECSQKCCHILQLINIVMQKRLCIKPIFLCYCCCSKEKNEKGNILGVRVNDIGLSWRDISFAKVVCDLKRSCVLNIHWSVIHVLMSIYCTFCQ